MEGRAAAAVERLMPDVVAALPRASCSMEYYCAPGCAVSCDLVQAPKAYVWLGLCPSSMLTWLLPGLHFAVQLHLCSGQGVS